MKTVILSLLFGLSIGAFAYVVGVLVCGVVERELKSTKAAGREEVAIETLRALLKLQESTTEGWKAMMELASASREGCRPSPSTLPALSNERAITQPGIQ
jgi:hypothetical protein